MPAGIGCRRRMSGASSARLSRSNSASVRRRTLRRGRNGADGSMAAMTTCRRSNPCLSRRARRMCARREMTTTQAPWRVSWPRRLSCSSQAAERSILAERLRALLAVRMVKRARRTIPARSPRGPDRRHLVSVVTLFAISAGPSLTRARRMKLAAVPSRSRQSQPPSPDRPVVGDVAARSPAKRPQNQPHVSRRKIKSATPNPTKSGSGSAAAALSPAAAHSQGVCK